MCCQLNSFGFTLSIGSANEITAQLKLRRNAYRARYNELWLSTGKEDDHPVDAILCPVGPGAAPPHGNAKYWSYTSQWNMLEYPAVAFPVTTVDQEMDVVDVAYTALNAQDRFNYDLYEPSRYVDAPVGLQLVTRRFEDEKCLAILEVIEKALAYT
jgi:amidase